MVKSPPADAEDTGSVSGPGTEISHAVEQLSPCAATTEALVLKPAIHKRSHTMRSLCRASKSSPCSRQLEKAHAQQGRPSAAKNKQIIQFFLIKRALKKGWGWWLEVGPRGGACIENSKAFGRLRLRMCEGLQIGV